MSGIIASSYRILSYLVFMIAALFVLQWRYSARLPAPFWRIVYILIGLVIILVGVDLVIFYGWGKILPKQWRIVKNIPIDLFIVYWLIRLIQLNKYYKGISDEARK